MDIITVNGLRKKYGRVTALDGMDFGVNEGEIYGIIGPDGAGKTTLFRILATLCLPTPVRLRSTGLTSWPTTVK